MRLVRIATSAAVLLFAGCSSLTRHHHLIWLCGTINGQPFRVSVDDRLYIETKTATTIDVHPCSKAERKARPSQR